MKRIHWWLSLMLTLTLSLSLLMTPFLVGNGTVMAQEQDPPPQEQTERLASPRALSVTSAAQTGIVVAVFDDPAYVDTGGGTGSESENVKAGLAMMGHTVQPFTGITEADWVAALAGADVLVIPELEMNNSLGSNLSPAARTVIADFVDQGGGLIQFYHGGSHFLNPVFGFSLTHGGGSASTLMAAAATGTAFTGGPPILPENDATWGLNSSTFPSGGLAIYSSGGNNAEVAWLPYGAGQIVYLGWDWYNAAPRGGQDSGWLEVLERAVLQVSGGGIGLFPSTARGYGLAGETVLYTYTLFNGTEITDTYTLALGGNSWPTTLSYSVTPSVPPYTTLALTVTVDIPTGAVAGDSDTATLTATSVTSPTEYVSSSTLHTMVSSGEYGYVFVQDANRIEILDTVLHEAVGAIDATPFGAEPLLGGLSPDGAQLYVSLWDSASVLVVDTATQTPITPTLPVGSGPRNVAFTPNGAYAFVPNRGDNTVSIIDTAAYTVAATLDVGSSPMIVATSPCLEKAYVTNRGGILVNTNHVGNSVSVIDTTTLSVTDVITGFNRPWGIVISPFGHWAYVTNQDDGSIGVIDTATDTLIATWELGGEWLQMIDISPDGRTLYVVDNNRGALLMVDAFSGELLDLVPAERASAWYIERFPESAGPYAYFSRAWKDGGGSVAVVNTDSGQLVKTIQLQSGGEARGTALFPMEDTCRTGAVAVSPVAPHRIAPAGEIAVFHQRVTNLSPLTDTFALTLSASPWPTTLSATSTGLLAPGASFLVTVTVALPADAPPGTLETVTLTATGTGGADAATLTASVLQPGFVFNEDENVIHVVDTLHHLDSGIEIDVSTYGGSPYRGELSPDGRQLYVGLRGNDSVLIVDTVALTPTGALLAGSGPHDITFSPDGAHAFVANRWGGTVTVIDTAIPTVTTTLPVGSQPRGLAATCCDTLYVTLRNDDAVAVVDTEALTVTSVITGFDEPHGITLAPMGDRVYVVNQGASSVGVIDTETQSLIATWMIPGDWIANVDISPDGQRLYVTDANMGDIHVVDTATGALLATVTGTGDGWTAWDVESLAPAGGPFAYATFPYDGWVGVVNTMDNTLEKVLPLGRGGDLRGLALFPPLRFCHQIYLPLVLRNATP